MSMHPSSQQEPSSPSEQSKGAPRCTGWSAQKLTLCAMLTAMAVLIAFLCKELFTFNLYYRLTFENLPILIGGIVFGPIAGGLIAVATDLFSCLLAGNAINPLITVGALAVGVTAGLIPRLLRRKQAQPALSAPVLALTVGSAHLLGQVFLKSIAKMIWFGIPWWGMFIGLGLSVCAGVVEFFAIRLLFRNPSIAKHFERLGFH